MKKLILAIIVMLVIPAVVLAGSAVSRPYTDNAVERLLEKGVGTVKGDTIGTDTSVFYGMGDKLQGIEPNMGLLERPTITKIDGADSIYITEVDALFFPDTSYTRFAFHKTISAGTISLIPNAVNYIYASCDNGTASYKTTTDRTIVEFSCNIPVARVYKNNGDISVTQVGIQGRGLIEKLLTRVYRTDPFAVEDGLLLSDTGTLNYEISSGQVWYGSNRIEVAKVRSASDSSWHFYHSGGEWVQEEAGTYNNFWYDNGTNRVELTNSNRFGISWIYGCLNDQSDRAQDQNEPRGYLLYGSSDYGTLALAKAEVPPSDVPPPVENNGKLVGRIIINKNGNTTLKRANLISVRSNIKIIEKGKER